jgi:hypothetical protein
MSKGRANMKQMKPIGSAVLLVLLSGTSARAQLNVVNPDNLDVPQARAEILYREACRAVAEQFHIHKKAQIEFPVTLHISQDDVDTSHIDEITGSYTVHMTTWDESAFVSRVITLCLFRLLPDSRRWKLVAKARGRADGRASVISVAQLQGNHKGANGLR